MTVTMLLFNTISAAERGMSTKGERRDRPIRNLIKCPIPSICDIPCHPRRGALKRSMPHQTQETNPCTSR